MGMVANVVEQYLDGKSLMYLEAEAHTSLYIYS